MSVGHDPFVSGSWRGAAQRLAERTDWSWEDFDGAVVLVVGASGVIGRLLLAALNEVSAARGDAFRLVSASRHPRPVPMGAVGRNRWVQWDIGRPRPSGVDDALKGARDLWVFHCAAEVKSARMVADPLAVLHDCVVGTENVLALSRDHEARRVVYLSSVEAHGRWRSCGETDSVPALSEDELGELALEDPRSCYPLGKRMAEHLCHLYRHQHGLDSVIVRPGPTLGIGLPPDDTRMVAAFIRAALLGEDIVLRTEGRSRMNFIDSEDLITGILTAAMRAQPGATLDIVDEAASRTVREFAELVSAELGEGRSRVLVNPVDRTTTGLAADVTHRLSSARLRELGWEAGVPLHESIRRVAGYWSESDPSLR